MVVHPYENKSRVTVERKKSSRTYSIVQNMIYVYLLCICLFECMNNNLYIYRWENRGYPTEGNTSIIQINAPVFIPQHFAHEIICWQDTVTISLPKIFYESHNLVVVLRFQNMYRGMYNGNIIYIIDMSRSYRGGLGPQSYIPLAIVCNTGITEGAFLRSCVGMPTFIAAYKRKNMSIPLIARHCLHGDNTPSGMKPHYTAHPPEAPCCRSCVKIICMTTSIMLTLISCRLYPFALYTNITYIGGSRFRFIHLGGDNEATFRRYLTYSIVCADHRKLAMPYSTFKLMKHRDQCSQTLWSNVASCTYERTTPPRTTEAILCDAVVNYVQQTTPSFIFLWFLLLILLMTIYFCGYDIITWSSVGHIVPTGRHTNGLILHRLYKYEDTMHFVDTDIPFIVLKTDTT